jgi:hypothetical protein
MLGTVFIFVLKLFYFLFPTFILPTVLIILLHTSHQPFLAQLFFIYRLLFLNYYRFLLITVLMLIVKTLLLKMLHIATILILLPNQLPSVLLLTVHSQALNQTQATYIALRTFKCVFLYSLTHFYSRIVTLIKQNPFYLCNSTM